MPFKRPDPKLSFDGPDARARAGESLQVPAGSMFRWDRPDSMEQRNPRLRWLIVWVVAAVWMVAVLARLSYLQLFCYSDYLAKAQHQQQRIFEISPKRGTIYDRKGRELAVSLPMDSVFADPAEITDARWWRACFLAC